MDEMIRPSWPDVAERWERAYNELAAEQDAAITAAVEAEREAHKPLLTAAEQARIKLDMIDDARLNTPLTVGREIDMLDDAIAAIRSRSNP